MYALLEANDSRKNSDRIIHFDGMGYTKTEKAAIEWLKLNPKYRWIIYIPDREVKEAGNDS